MGGRRTVLILTGEPSGDRAGASVARALQQQEPGLRVLAVGGPHLRAAGAEIVQPIEELGVMGFAEVLRHVPKLRALERRLARILEEERPVAVIPIDYPGFNLRIARRAKAAGIPVVYYIGPQVWAWGAGRVPKIAAVVDRMLVVFPFEEAIYREAGVRTDFVGHPLLDDFAARPERGEARASLGLDEGRRVLGLVPGSRIQEVRRILPAMLETADRLRRDDPELAVLVSTADSVPAPEFDAILGDAAARGVQRVPGPAAFVMRAADALLVTSGTATLEAALDGTPLAVLYRTSALTWFLGRRLVRIPRISLVNIVAEEDLVAEFLQSEATADRVAPHVAGLLEPGAPREALKARLAGLRSGLGSPGVADRVARIVREEAGA